MREANDSPAGARTRPWLAYSAAVVATAGAALLRWGLDPWLGQTQPFPTFYVAVMLVTLGLGWRAGLAAAVLGFVIGDWFFLPPRGSFRIESWDSLAHVLIYWLVAATLIYSLHRSRAAAHALTATHESLRQSEERLRATFQKAAVGIMEVDTQGRCTAANERLCQILGYRPAELAGKTVHELTAPEDLAVSDQLNAELREGRRERLDYEKRYRRRDGSPLWVHVTASAVRDGAGRVLFFIGTAEDIAERKRAEGALLQAKQEWERTFDSVPDLIAIIDGTHHIKRVNRALAERLGLAPEHCVGRPCFECIHGRTCAPEFCPHTLTLADGRIHTGEVHEERLGGDFLVTTTPLLDEQGRLLGAVHISRDITERKQAETTLRQQARLAQLRADAIQALQQPGAFGALLQSVTGLLVERLEAAFARVWTLDPTGQTLELQASAGLYTHLDGAHSRVPVGQLKIGRIAQERRPLVTNQVLGDPNVPNQEWVHRQGLVAFAGMPLLLEGRLLGVVAFFSRHTLSPAVVETFESIAGTLAQTLGRKQAELALHASQADLARANAALEQRVRERTAKLQETVAELEQFSYTLTHDMRAPLRAMRGLGGVLLEECAAELPPERYQHLRRIAEAAERMDRLITDALQYSGLLRQAWELEPVDAHALLRGILESYPQFQPPQVRVRIEGHLPVVVGNKAAMTQCFSHLLSNAVKFVAPGHTPAVRVWAEGLEASAGPAARIWFEDNGIGIERQYLDKIWVMFQRLDKRHEGTGIGLALVSKAVARMGGQVGVESELGHGSRFWVQLPQPPGRARGPAPKVVHAE